jgi:hypothetical protein
MRGLQSLMFAAGTPTPGTGPPAPLPEGAVPPLVITEVFANAGQGQRDAAFEWVEIFNPTNARVDLDGWRIADNAASDALSGGIPAMSYVVIIASPDAIGDAFRTNTIPVADAIAIADGRIGNGLANSGDTVTLLDPAGRVVDRVDFSGPPLPRPERDRSIARIESGWILNLTPTPGRAGATPLLASLAGANDQNPANPDGASPPVRVVPEEGGGFPAWPFVLVALALPLTTVAVFSLRRRWRPQRNGP